MDRQPTPDPRLPGDSWRIPLPTGTQIDHYVVDTVLGAGGFGITYLANHFRLAKTFAIKEYFPNDFSFREGRSVMPTATNSSTYRWGLDRFLAEARALAKFKHPSIVDVVSVFEANDTAYIVLADESGLSFRDWLDDLDRPVSQLEIDAIAADLLDALEEVHAHDLLHRDIAPDNIMIRADGTPVLIDFGAARASLRGVAQAYSVIVKKGYSPPEQYSSSPENQGPWTDIYAMSATFYKAVTGKTPQDATDRLLRDTLEPIASSLSATGFRPGFLAAIDHGLRLEPAVRPRDVATWRRALFGHGRAPAFSATSRPDLSALDVQQPSERTSLPSYFTPKNVQTFNIVLSGVVGGAIAGLLCSFAISSVMTPNCFADECLMRYSQILVSMGALVGGIVGIKTARRR